MHVTYILKIRVLPEEMSLILQKGEYLFIY